MSDCGCGCSETITTTGGSQGDDGTSTSVTTSPISTVAAYHGFTTVSRANTSTDDIYNGGSGYTTALFTVPTVAAANVLIFDINAQITATDVHDLTVQLLLNGAPIANSSMEQNCGTRERISWRFQIGNVSTGGVYTINFLSSSAIVTARLRGALFTTEIYA